MKTTKWIAVALLAVIFVSLPAVADAHWRRGGRVFLGFGAGFLTGYLVAPRPVYVAPPVYAPPVYVTPPPVEYRYYPYYVPVPPPPEAPAPSSSPPPYASSPNVAAPSAPVPPPTAQAAPSSQAKCREWRMIERYWEDRWDSDLGRWRKVPVEKWDWADVPCPR